MFSLYSLLLLLVCADALKFDIEAFQKGDSRSKRCIRNFVGRDTLVVVTSTIDGRKGDGMILDLQVGPHNCSLIEGWLIGEGIDSRFYGQ